MFFKTQSFITVIISLIIFSCPSGEPTSWASVSLAFSALHIEDVFACDSPQTQDQPFFFSLNTRCAHLLQASVGGRYDSEDDRETVCIQEANLIPQLLPPM